MCGFGFVSMKWRNRSVRPRRYRKRRMVSSSYSGIYCQCYALARAMRRLLHVPLTRPGGRVSCHRCSCACSRLRRVSCARQLARRLPHCLLLCLAGCRSPGGVLGSVPGGSAGGERNVLCSLACPGSTESGLSAFLCKRFLAVKHAPSPRRGAGKSARVALTPNFLKPLILVSWSWSWSCISTSSLVDTSAVEGPSESIMLFRAILPDRAVGRVLLRVCCWRLRAVASSDVFFERELWSMKGVTRGAVVVSVR
jgi:hypothetical protein